MAEDILSRAIDRIFSMKRATLYLIFIFLLGAILRVIGAINFSVAADDMHHVTAAINFLSAGRLVTYDQSSGLWHAFTSVIYNIFGLTQLTSRFSALLFGSFSILLIYFLSKEFFDERVSLISAFLLAINPFHIKSTMAEMDVMAMFFALLSMLIFIKALKLNKKTNYFLSGIFMGLSLYTKLYPALFMPSLLLYFIYVNRKAKNKIITKDNAKKIAIFLIPIFLFMLPTLTHNYLLYKDKGFVDLIFTRFTGIGKNISAQYYSWDSSFTESNSWKGLFLGNTKHIPDGTPLLWAAINFIRVYDPLSFYIGLLGLILILLFHREKRDYVTFFLLGIIFLLPFLASSILLVKHYIFLSLLLMPMASFFILQADKYAMKMLNKKTLVFILALILVFSMLFLGLAKNSAPFYGKSHIAQMIEFKNSNIPKNALIVMDSRIYRGRINWVSQERPYLEGTDFISAINQQENIPGKIIPLEVFYFECIKDDCGWGTVKNQPEFNSSMESLTDFFKNNGQLMTSLTEPNVDESYFPIISNNRIDVINIYKANINAKDSILSFANQPKNWFLYPIGYLPIEKNFDYYSTNNAFEFLLDKLAHGIVLIAVIFAFLSPLYVIYLLKQDGTAINNHPGL